MKNTAETNAAVKSLFFFMEVPQTGPDNASADILRELCCL